MLLIGSYSIEFYFLLALLISSNKNLNTIHSITVDNIVINVQNKSVSNIVHPPIYKLA